MRYTRPEVAELARKTATEGAWRQVASVSGIEQDTRENRQLVAEFAALAELSEIEVLELFVQEVMRGGPLGLGRWVRDLARDWGVELEGK